MARSGENASKAFEPGKDGGANQGWETYGFSAGFECLLRVLG